MDINEALKKIQNSYNDHCRVLLEENREVFERYCISSLELYEDGFITFQELISSLWDVSR